MFNLWASNSNKYIRGFARQSGRVSRDGWQKFREVFPSFQCQELVQQRLRVARWGSMCPRTRGIALRRSLLVDHSAPQFTTYNSRQNLRLLTVLHRYIMYVITYYILMILIESHWSYCTTSIYFWLSDYTSKSWSNRHFRGWQPWSIDLIHDEVPRFLASKNISLMIIVLYT